MNIIYKMYNNNDYEFVYKLKKEAYIDYVIKYYGVYDDNDQRKRFDNRINEVKDNTYIIIYNNKKVGFYTINEYKDIIELENICILKEYQGLGIGTKVLCDIINKNKDIKLQYFKNNPVVKLYTKLGFIPDGENKYHYKMIRRK